MASPLNRQNPIHFIGIGGIGMSALAMILAERGQEVSGSEPKQSPIVHQLGELGISVFSEQVAATIEQLVNRDGPSPQIVVSTAIPDHNPELVSARAHNLEILHRSDVLAALIEDQPSIAVAGSHGKTTTSTVITTLLEAVGEDPTAVIGGVVPCYGSNGHAGTGPLLVAEADESDGSLVKFSAQLGVITNLELDHTDHYAGLNDLIATLKQFGAGCQKLLANHDDPILREHFEASAWWSVSTPEGVNYACLPVALEGDRTEADFYENGVLIGRISLPMPRLHNLCNATAAMAAVALQRLCSRGIGKEIRPISTPFS